MSMNNKTIICFKNSSYQENKFSAFSNFDNNCSDICFSNEKK